MRLVMAKDPRPTLWFWGINGPAGVFAAGLAVALSIGSSIDATIRGAGVTYILLAVHTLNPPDDAQIGRGLRAINLLQSVCYSSHEAILSAPVAAAGDTLNVSRPY
jgi:hypothetical protein